MARQQLNIQISVAGAEKSLKTLSTRVDAVTASFNKLASVNARSSLGALGVISTNVDKLGASFKTAGGGQDIFVRKTKKTREAIDVLHIRLNSFHRRLGSLGSVGGNALAGFTAKLLDLTGMLRNGSPAVRKFATGLVALAGAFAGLAVIGVTQAIGRFVRGMFDAMQTVQSFRNALTAITGSTEEASKSLAFVTKTSYELGLGLKGSVIGFRKFVTSAKLSGVTTKAAQGAYKKMSEVLTVLHANTDQTSRSFLALEQMFSKGKVSTEELRRQLGEIIPGAFNIMAESIGVTSGELDGMLRSGEVGIDRIIPFIELLSKKFSGGLVEAMRSPVAAFGRLGNAAEQLQVALGGNLFGGMAIGVNQLANALRGSGINAFFSILMRTVGVALGAVATGLAVVLQGVNLLLSPLAALTSIASNLTEAFFHMYDAIFNPSDKAKVAIEELTDAQKQWEKISTASFNFVGDAFEAFVAIISAVSLARFFTKFKTGAKVFGTISTVLAGLGGVLRGVVTALGLAPFVTWVVGLTGLSAGFTAVTTSAAIATTGITVFGTRAALMWRSVLLGTGVMGKLSVAFGILKAAILGIGTAIIAASKNAGRLLSFLPVGKLLAIGAAVGAVGYAVYKLIDPFKEADTGISKMNGKMLELQNDARKNKLSLEGMTKELKNIANFEMPSELYIPLAGVPEEAAKKLKKIGDESIGLAKSLGYPNDEAKILGGTMTQLIGISEDLITSTQEMQDAFEAELEFIEKTQRAIDGRMVQIGREIAARKAQGKSVVALTGEFKTLGEFTGRLAKKAIILKIQSGNVPDAIEKINEINTALDANGQRDELRAKVAEGDATKLLEFTQSIKGVGAAMDDVATKDLSGAAADMDKLASSAEKLDTKVNNVTWEEFNASIKQAISDGISWLFKWNETAIKNKSATVTITTNKVSGSTDTGGTEDLPQFRDGGNFASFPNGTRNTNSVSSSVASGGDGGFPAILHRGEAVVPLKNGRDIPVKIDFPTQGAYASGGSSRYEQSAAPNTTTNNSPVNVTVNVQTQDAASFNRSQTQIYQDIQRNVSRAVRTVRS